VSTAAKVQKELELVTGVKQRADEPLQDYLIRLLDTTAKLPNASWQKLSSAAQTWYDAAATAWNNKQPVPTIDLTIANEAGGDTEQDSKEDPMQEEASTDAAPAETPTPPAAVTKPPRKPAKVKADKVDREDAKRGPTQAQIVCTRAAIDLYRTGQTVTAQALTKALKDSAVEIPTTTIKRVSIFVPLVLDIYTEPQT
jgi:hypothetical protein